MKRQWAIGVDLGGTNCRAALVSEDGVLTGLRRKPIRHIGTLDAFVGFLVSFCRVLMTEAREQGGDVSSVCLGVPGIVSQGGVVHFSPNLPFLNGCPLALDLSERLGLPVAVFNDANAIAWGEGCFGAGREFRSFLAVTLGTGVGGGVVLDRRLWVGTDGAAGEIGHFTVEAEGRPCGCGSRGCLEQYSSAPGIVETYRQLCPQPPGKTSSGSYLDEITCEAVAAAARLGDRGALKAFAEGGKRLGQLLSGVANLLNIDGAVICGGVSASLDLLRPALEAELVRRVVKNTGTRLKIVRGELGDGAGIIGAAALVYDRLGHADHLVLERSGSGHRGGESD